MKKLLALLLVVVMCLGMLASCSFFGGDETPDGNGDVTDGTTPDEGNKPDEEKPEDNNKPAGPTVDAAASFLYDIYKTENGKKVKADFDIVKQVMIEGVLFPVAWTVDTDLISFKDSATAGYLTVDVPDENATEITFTLTATVADANGNTAVKTFNRILDSYYYVPEGPEKPDMVSEPQVGVEYKLYIYQNFLKKHLFATSAIETQYNQYLISTEDYNEAMSVYVEVVDGGYNFYTMLDGAKKYINVADKQSGTNNDGSPKYYAGVVYGDEATSVWTYVADINAWSVKYETREYVIGTYGNYNDYRFSAISYYYGTQASTQCAAGLLTVEMAENLPEWPTVEIPETPAPEVNKGYNIVGVNKDGDLYFDGGISSGRFSGSSDASKAIVVFVKAGANDGEYLLCFYDADNRANYLVINDSSTGAALTFYVDEASVFEWNGTLATFVVADDSNNRAFGTSETSTYTTFSCYDVSNIYAWGEYKLVEGATEPESITPPPEKEPEVGPATMTLTEALAAADGTKIVVSGKVVAINQAWSEQYGNISVTIEDADGVQLYVYRMKTNVAEGDIITVTGEMTTYSNARQVAAGATAVITGHEDVADYAEYTIPEILQLPDNTKIIVKGTVSEIVGAWDSSFGNMNVNIVDADGNVLYVYRLSTQVALGDIVTITGLVGSYNGAKQVAQGATAEITGHDDSYDSGETPEDPDTPVDPDPDTPAIPTPGAPEVGKGYYIVGVNANGNLYFNGTVSSNRFNAATSADGAVVVYVALVGDGQYVIYFDVDGTANYIVMADKSQGASLTTDKSAATVFEWNASLKTMEVEDDDNARAFGTNNTTTYNNFNCYAVSNASDPVYSWGQFVAVDGGNDPVDPPVDPKPEVPEYTEMTLTEALAAADGTKIIVSGKVVAINQAWSEQYGNISVTIEDADGVQLYVYRMKTNVAEGDIITVTGEMTTYSNARQVAAGATAVITGHEDVADYAEYTIPEILQLPDNTKIIVKGIVSEIVKAWDETYGNLSVNIVDADGNVLYVYRLSTKVEVNDIITITGLVGSYNGAKQIAQGATAEITGKYEPAPEVDYSALDALDGQYVINFIMNGAYYLTFNKAAGTLTLVDNIGDFDGTYFYSYDAATGITVDGADIVFAVDGENVTVSIGGGAAMTLVEYEEPSVDPDPETPDVDFSVLNGEYDGTFYGMSVYTLTFDSGFVTVVDNNSGAYTGLYAFDYATGVASNASASFTVSYADGVFTAAFGAVNVQLVAVGGGDDDDTADGELIVLDGEQGSIILEATDTYGAFDLYTVKASVAGTYNFAFAAGTGMILKETDEAWGMPEVNFYDGGVFNITLEADESFTFYFMSVSKGPFEVQYSTGEIVIVTPTELQVGENVLSFTEDQLIDGIECTFFPTVSGLYNFVSDTLGANIYSEDGTRLGRNSAQLESYVSYKVVIYGVSASEAGEYSINIVAPISLDYESDNTVNLYDFQIADGFVATVYPWDTGALTITAEYLNVTGVIDPDGNALVANADGSYNVSSWTKYTIYFEAKEGATAGEHIISCALLAAPGTVNNPYTLAESNNVAFDAEGNVYFAYTAPATGHIVFGCDAENLEIRDTNWNFYTVGASYLVIAGQTYTFCFGTTDYAALDTVVTVSFTEGEPTDDDYKNMLNGGFFYVDQYEVSFTDGMINVSLYDWTIWDFTLNLWFDYSITLNDDGTLTIVPAYVYTEGEVGEDFGFAGAIITATYVEDYYEFSHNIAGSEEPDEPTEPDVPAELEGEIYIGTDAWGNEIIVAISDTTVTFVIREENHAYTYIFVDGAFVLYNADGSEVMALMASVTADENGVPTAAVYNGTNYTLAAAESDDEPEIPEEPVVNYVAEINGVGYESLEAALEAAEDYSVIKLLDNITLTAQLTIRKNVFIDLNGCTISGDFESDYGMIYVAPEFELDIFDTAETKGAIVSSGSYAIGVYGILYIYADIDVISTATYNVDGVDYEYAAIYVFAQGETAGFADIAEAYVSAIWNSGSLNFAADADVIISSGNCNISGGTIGEFISEDGATAAISGGIFGNDVSAWVAADYICVANDDGTFSIKYLPTISIADAELYEDGTEVIVSGTVTAITTAWNDSYGNITVVLTDETGSITLYRLSTKVVLGDIITVTGKIGSYNDVKQIAQGATAVITGHDSSYDYVEMTIADALKAADGTGVIVTGTVVEIGTAYDSYYNNISVYIADENGTQLYLYRLTGNVTVGQIITVKGSMATYGGQRQIGAGATFEVVGTHTCSNFTEATCESAAKCIVCGTANGEALEHVFVDGECENCGAAEDAKEVISATLSFADKANRTVFNTSQQVWAQNGITLTNDKGSSTSNVADYANPARFYKSSKITVAHEGMVKIVFTCNNASYATALKSSISGANVTVDGKNVTVTFDEPVDSFVIASLTGGQVRMDSMTVYYEA